MKKILATLTTSTALVTLVAVVGAAASGTERHPTAAQAAAPDVDDCQEAPVNARTHRSDRARNRWG